MKVAKPSLSQMSDQLLDRDVVAEPLVRELVDDEARGAAADRRVGGPGLVLQREARVEAGRDAADDRERVVAEVLLEAGDDRRGLLHQPHAGRLVALAQLLRDRDEPRQAAVLALLDREVAGGEEREVGHHRLVGAPVPLRRVACRPCGRAACRWRRPRGRWGPGSSRRRRPCRAGGRWRGTTTAPCAARSWRRPRSCWPASCAPRRRSTAPGGRRTPPRRCACCRRPAAAPG